MQEAGPQLGRPEHSHLKQRPTSRGKSLQGVGESGKGGEQGGRRTEQETKGRTSPWWQQGGGQKLNRKLHFSGLPKVPFIVFNEWATDRLTAITESCKNCIITIKLLYLALIEWSGIWMCEYQIDPNPNQIVPINHPLWKAMNWKWFYINSLPLPTNNLLPLRGYLLHMDWKMKHALWWSVIRSVTYSYLPGLGQCFQSIHLKEGQGK